MNGARKVYAVDNASTIIRQASLIVEHNKLSHIITLIEGKIEKITLPEKVDIIVSEWMGYFLLYEYMIESLIYARDNWLKEGGKMFPSKASLFLCPFSEPSLYEERLSKWGEMEKEYGYGVDFTPLIPLAKSVFFSEPQIQVLEPTKEISFSSLVKQFDLLKVTLEEVESFSSTFSFYSIGSSSFNGFAGWFQVDFNQSEIQSEIQTQIRECQNQKQSFPLQQEKKKGEERSLILSTSPSSTPTHWRQTLFFFDPVVNVFQDDLIEGSFTVCRSPKSRRGLLVSFQFKVSSQSFSKQFYLH